MGDCNDVTTPPHLERRKYRRFNLRYPVHGTFSSENKVSEFDAVSTNVSIGGLLMETASEISPHSLVNFTMTLQGGMVVRPICLEGQGEAVRLGPAETGTCFLVAVTCKRPIAQQKN
jgi:hypothetical protein